MENKKINPDVVFIIFYNGIRIYMKLRARITNYDRFGPRSQITNVNIAILV